MIITNTREFLKKYLGWQILAINGNPIDDLINDSLVYVPISHKDEMMNDVALELCSTFDANFIYNIALKSPLEKMDTIQLSPWYRSYRPGRASYYKDHLASYRKFLGNITYLNFDEISYDEFKNISADLVNAKSIIIDLRGYPNIGTEIFSVLGLFKNIKDSVMWMFKPNVTKPDKVTFNSFTETNWTLKRAIPQISAKIVLVTDHHAQSYAESVIGYLSELDNVTIVGSQTAGINGNVNRFTLPGGYAYRYTGMKVLKHDGSRLHGIGFLPDVEVRPTIQGIIEGRDEVLEKAIELASAN